MELQEQTNGYIRDLRGVQLRLATSQREAKSNQVLRHNAVCADGVGMKVWSVRSVSNLFSKNRDLCTRQPVAW